jgi:predicted nucleic acid-binding protein
MNKVMLPATDYLHVLEQADALGIRGGAVYDALILACARKARAETIWTLNARHFMLFAADLGSSIREP